MSAAAPESPGEGKGAPSRLQSRAVGVTISGLAFVVLVVLLNEMVNIAVTSSRLRGVAESAGLIGLVSINSSFLGVAANLASSPSSAVLAAAPLAPAPAAAAAPTPSEAARTPPGTVAASPSVAASAAGTAAATPAPLPPSPPPSGTPSHTAAATPVKPSPSAAATPAGTSSPSRLPASPAASAPPPRTPAALTGPPPSLADDHSPAGVRLRALLSDPLAGCTPEWRKTMAEYTAFHRKGLQLLAARSPDAPRAVVYECLETPDDSVLVSQDCGGLADRLVGLTHIFLFAVVNKYLLFIDWPNHVATFHSPFISMAYNASLATYDGRTHKEDSYVGCPDRVGKCPLGLNDSEVSMDQYFGAHVTHVRLNRGGIRWGTVESRKRLVDLGLDKETAGGCAYHSILHPNDAVIERFRDTALQILDPDIRVIAIHKRTGDRAMHLLETPAINWGDDTWSCADKRKEALENVSGKPVKFFFVADNRQYKDEAVARYGGKLFTTETKPMHINKQQLHWDGIIYRPSPFPAAIDRLAGTLGDWWLMSLADLIIMPGFSGYSRTAFAYSMKPTAVCTEPFEGQGLYGCHRNILQSEMALLGAGYR